MRFDPVDRRYEDNNGRPLTPKEIRDHLEEYISSEQAVVDREAQQFLESQALDIGSDAKFLLIAGFFAYLANKIREWHSVAGVIAYGGEDEMNPERWARLGAKIDSELTYLQGFEEFIRNSRIATDLIVSHVRQKLDEHTRATSEST